MRALELGDDAQHREQEPHVLRHRGLQGELALHELLDVGVERVDDLVSLGQRLGRVPVPGQEGVGGGRHPLADESEELHDLLVDLFQVPMEGDPDLLGHGSPLAPSRPLSRSGR